MALGLTPEHLELAAAVRGWAERHCPVDVPRAASGQPDGGGQQYRDALGPSLAAQGVLGLHLPEKHGGQGYGLPAAIGAAHANKSLGRFTVSIQGDGDMMYAPGAFWTAAHHRIPSLAIVDNNRGYHQEVMHVQRLSNFRNRVASLGGDMGPIGTSIMNPDIEYHKLAESMGWWAKGPIKDPADLGPAIKQAVAAVKAGQPALVNVWTQPR